MVNVTRPSVKQVWDWLDTIPDPEIPVITLVDLGIIRDVEWQGERLVITITPTYSGCPATRVIAEDITALISRKGVKSQQLERRLSPAWTTEWMSEKGRAALEKYGIAPPQTKGTPARCPHCRGNDVARISQFGSTPCKALWRCKTCLEPFDYFKCI